MCSKTGDATALALILDTSACVTPPSDRWLNTVLVDFTWAFCGLSGGGGTLQAFVVDPAHSERVPQALRATLSVPVHCARRWEGVASLAAWREAPIDIVVALRLPRHFGPGHFVYDAGLRGMLTASLFGDEGIADHVQLLEGPAGICAPRCVTIDTPRALALVGPEFAAAQGHGEWGFTSVAALCGDTVKGREGSMDHGICGRDIWTHARRAVHATFVSYMASPVFCALVHAITAVLALTVGRPGPDPTFVNENMHAAADATVHVFAPTALASVGTMSGHGVGAATWIWRRVCSLLGKVFFFTRPLRALAYAAGLVDTWPYPNAISPTTRLPSPAVAIRAPAAHAVYGDVDLMRAAIAGRDKARRTFVHTFRETRGSAEETIFLATKTTLTLLWLGFLQLAQAFLQNYTSLTVSIFAVFVGTVLLFDASTMGALLLDGRWMVVRPALRPATPQSDRVERTVSAVSRVVGWVVQNIAVAVFVVIYINGGFLLERAARWFERGRTRSDASVAAGGDNQ